MQVQKIAMQDVWVNSVFENDPAIEFVTLEQATSQGTKPFCPHAFHAFTSSLSDTPDSL